MINYYYIIDLNNKLKKTKSIKKIAKLLDLAKNDLKNDYLYKKYDYDYCYYLTQIDALSFKYYHKRNFDFNYNLNLRLSIYVKNIMIPTF